MKNTYVGQYVRLSELLAPVFALFARPSARFLGAVLVAMTLSSCALSHGDLRASQVHYFSVYPEAERQELEEKIARCDEFVVCSNQEWEEIEELAEKTGGDVERVREIRESEQNAERRVLDFYLDTCGRSELDDDQQSDCSSGFWRGVNLGGVETIAENEGKTEQLRKVREALEPKESEPPVASFDIQDFQKLVDDVVQNMGADPVLQKELRGTRPTLLITSVINRSGANISPPIINDAIQIRLHQERQFTLVNWDPLETLREGQGLEPNGLLADDDAYANDVHNVFRLGQLAGAQYVLNGSIAAEQSDEDDGDIVYTLTLTVTDIQAGVDVWSGKVSQ